MYGHLLDRNKRSRDLSIDLPRLAGIDVHGLDLVLSQPLEHCRAEELRSVVATDDRRRSPFAHQATEDLE